MKRSLPFVLLLAFLGPACRTAGPRVAPGTAPAVDPLRAYVDELRLVRHKGDKPRIRIDARESVAGSCAVAVRVRTAAFAEGSAQFSLETLGVPRVKGQPAECKRVDPELRLVIFGFPPTPGAAELTARVDAVLQTSEAYLASKGVRFELAAGEVPAEVASREVFATNAEATLGRRVTAWPTPLLSVDPWYHDSRKRLRQQSEVELEAIVGSDGRLHRPRLRMGLGDAHESAVLRPLPLWRFEPARRGETPVDARIALRPVLHIYY